MELKLHSLLHIHFVLKWIIIDYGGPNVAKILHVGHLRSANIGEALKRLAKYLGHDVIGDVHLGVIFFDSFFSNQFSSNNNSSLYFNKEEQEKVRLINPGPATDTFSKFSFCFNCSAIKCQIVVQVVQWILACQQCVLQFMNALKKEYVIVVLKWFESNFLAFLKSSFYHPLSL